jgi:hypothetical protein
VGAKVVELVAVVPAVVVIVVVVVEVVLAGDDGRGVA